LTRLTGSRPAAPRLTRRCCPRVALAGNSRPNATRGRLRPRHRAS
jgi:hypothetical protein